MKMTLVSDWQQQCRLPIHLPVVSWMILAQFQTHSKFMRQTAALQPSQPELPLALSSKPAPVTKPVRPGELTHQFAGLRLLLHFTPGLLCDTKLPRGSHSASSSLRHPHRLFAVTALQDMHAEISKYLRVCWTYLHLHRHLVSIGHCAGVMLATGEYHAGRP